MSVQPCGRCLNCRNGAPGLCMAEARTDAPKPIAARNCRCGKALFGKRRFCAECRQKRNTETAKTRMRAMRSRGVTKNRKKEAENIGPN